MSIKQKFVVQSLLKELPNKIIIRQIKKLTINPQQRYEESRVFRATKPLQLSNAQLLVKLKEKINSLLEEASYTIQQQIITLIKSLTPKYQKGDPLQKIEDIEKITFNQDGSFTKENSEFQVEQGIVYLLIIWDAEKQYCSARIDKYQSILEKNPQWEGKVQMVCISVNDEIESVIEVVKQNNWKSIQHYRFSKGCHKKNYFIQFTQMKGTPYVMLINKQGMIDYLGYYPKVNFEDRINELITANGNEGIQLAQELQEQMDSPEPQGLLTQEEYKELQQQWKTIQKAFKQAGFKGNIVIVFENVTFLKQDEPKEIYQNPKFILSYAVEVKEESKIFSFLENYWNKIPKHLRYVEFSNIIDPNKGTLDIKNKFQEIFQNLGVNITYITYYNTRFIYNQEKNEMNMHKTEKFYANVDNLTVELYQKGYKTLEDYVKSMYFGNHMNEIFKHKEIIDDLLNGISLTVGQQFQAIPNYKKLGSEQFTKIEHIPGQILILYYFLTPKIIINEDIELDLEVIKAKIEKWGDAVRFVYLSCEQNEEIQETIEYFQEKSDYIDYYFPKHKDQPDQILYQAFLNNHLVVDKFGRIRYIDTLFEIDQLIDQLITDQYIQSLTKEVKTVNMITQGTVNKVQDFLLSAEVQQKLNYLVQKQILKLDLDFQQIRVNGQLKFLVPSLNLFCRDSQLETIEYILKKIFELIPENNWEINKTISKTFSVPYPGAVCSLCNKHILNEVQQYYSPFKKVHLCVECAEFDDKTKKGSEKYKCTDNLIFINGPLTDQSVLENIDDHKIGKNRQLEKGDEGQQCHSKHCNSCLERPQGPRYIAVSARPGCYDSENGYIQYCQNCFLILKNKQSSEAQEIFEKGAEDGMVEDSLLVRILFSHGDYRDF